jgi:hypothetical protein
MKTIQQSMLIAVFTAAFFTASGASHAATAPDAKPAATKPATHHSPVDAKNPRVFLVDKKQIVVNQEPLYFPARAKNVRVTFHAPANSRARFGKDGVVFENAGDEIVDCKPSKDGRKFSCLNRHTKPGKYKYTIRLEGAKDQIAPLDPVLVND